jgi:glycosyltransferase involved in cell wall biosynthesis
VSKRLAFVLPGPLNRRTGGSIYDRKVVDGLRAQGYDVDVVELSGAYPFPSDAVRREAGEKFARIDDGTTTIVDGLAFGVLPEVAEREGRRLRLVALVHHPLADETGLRGSERDALMESEKSALEHAQVVIVTSNFTRRRLLDYCVAPERVHVILPGADPAPLAERNLERDLVLLCPASLIPRKGHSELFRALAGVADLKWRLICAGKTELDAACAANVRSLADELGIGPRVTFLGEVGEAEMGRLYAEADLLVLASHYEGYGMVVGEAIARGLPVVTTTGGALCETLPEGAGLACEPGDVRGLCENLRRVLSDRMLYERLALGARAARNTLPSWDDAARDFAKVLA